MSSSIIAGSNASPVRSQNPRQSTRENPDSSVQTPSDTTPQDRFNRDSRLRTSNPALDNKASNNSNTGSNTSDEPSSQFSTNAESAGRSPKNPSNGESSRRSGSSKPSEKSPLFQNQSGKTKLSGEPLTRQEQRELERMRKRDREVRRHEQAHLAAGGRFVRGGINFEFERGPTGERFVVDGSVNLDVSKERSPQETIQKMSQVRAAALAPAQPSPKDLSVAQSASRKSSQARQELVEQQQQKIRDKRESTMSTEQSFNPAQVSGGLEPIGNLSRSTRSSSESDPGDESSGSNSNSRFSRTIDRGNSSADREEPIASEQSSSAPEIQTSRDPNIANIVELERLESSSDNGRSAILEFDTGTEVSSKRTATPGSSLDFLV